MNKTNVKTKPSTTHRHDTPNNKTHIIKFRVTETEKMELQCTAKLLHLSLSTLIRRALHNAKIERTVVVAGGGEETLTAVSTLLAQCSRVGGYYYTCAVTQRQTEEELAALKIALRGKTFQLPLAIDVEDPRLRSLAPAKLSALVARAADQLEAWGLYAMVYTYTNFADTALDMAAIAAYDLWIADYRGTRPTRKHGMWQYTSSGRVPGISGPVDLSHAYKDYAAIIQRAGLGQVRG